MKTVLMVLALALLVPAAAYAGGLGGVWGLTETVANNTCKDSYAAGVSWGVVMSLNVDSAGKVDGSTVGNTSWASYTGAVASNRLVLDGERSGDRSNYNLEVLSDGTLKGTRTVSYTAACTMIVDVAGKKISP